ncbi:unnamed protein product, partial [Closterium sp. NIES-64]
WCISPLPDGAFPPFQMVHPKMDGGMGGHMMHPKMDAGMGGAKGGGGGEIGGEIGGEGGGAEGARGEVESVGEAMERGLLPLPLPVHRIVDLSRGEVESVGEAVERGLLPLPAHRIVNLCDALRNGAVWFCAPPPAPVLCRPMASWTFVTHCCVLRCAAVCNCPAALQNALLLVPPRAVSFPASFFQSSPLPLCGGSAPLATPTVWRFSPSRHSMRPLFARTPLCLIPPPLPPLPGHVAQRAQPTPNRIHLRLPAVAAPSSPLCATFPTASCLPLSPPVASSPLHPLPTGDMAQRAQPAPDPTLACVNSVRSAACWTHQREEEDFVTSAGGLPLEGRVGEAAVAPLRALLAGIEGSGEGDARKGKGEEAGKVGERQGDGTGGEGSGVGVGMASEGEAAALPRRALLVGLEGSGEWSRWGRGEVWRGGAVWSGGGGNFRCRGVSRRPSSPLPVGTPVPFPATCWHACPLPRYLLARLSPSPLPVGTPVTFPATTPVTFPATCWHACPLPRYLLARVSPSPLPVAFAFFTIISTRIFTPMPSACVYRSTHPTHPCKEAEAVREKQQQGDSVLSGLGPALRTTLMRMALQGVFENSQKLSGLDPALRTTLMRMALQGVFENSQKLSGLDPALRTTLMRMALQGVFENSQKLSGLDPALRTTLMRMALQGVFENSQKLSGLDPALRTTLMRMALQGVFENSQKLSGLDPALRTTLMRMALQGVFENSQKLSGLDPALRTTLMRMALQGVFENSQKLSGLDPALRTTLMRMALQGVFENSQKLSGLDPALRTTLMRMALQGVFENSQKLSGLDPALRTTLMRMALQGVFEISRKLSGLDPALRTTLMRMALQGVFENSQKLSGLDPALRTTLMRMALQGVFENSRKLSGLDPALRTTLMRMALQGVFENSQKLSGLDPALRKAPASGRKEQQQGDPVLSGLDPALLSALTARMQFRLALYDALSALQTARLPAHLPACALKIQLAQTALHKLKISLPPTAPAAGGEGGERGEGEQAEGGSGGQQTASGRAAPGMCPAINTHLLPPTPPRPTHLLTWHEALDHFSRLLTHLTFICHLPSTSPPDLLELSRFLAHFRALNPGPVARAALQLLLLREGLILSHDPTDVILHSLHLPPALLPPPGPAAGGAGGGGGVGGGDGGSSAALGKFVKKASHAVQAVLRAQCSNGARERRMLAKLLPDWSHLLSLAGDVDACDAVERYTTTNFAQGWWRESVATSWVVEYTCRIVIRYLQLGFSTRLYAPSEFLSAFWYLDSVLATLIHNVSAREASLQKPFTAPSSRKSRRKPAAVPPPSPPPPSLDLALITAYQLLCKAYVRLLAAFVLDGKLNQRPSPFNSDRQRYQQRYAVLKRVQLPEPLSYAAFQRAVSPAGLSVPELYQMSLDFFRTTASNLPTIHALAAAAAPGGTAGASEAVEGEVQQLERVCASNATALFVAHRAGAGSVLKASFEFAAHPFFPVVTLKRA